MSDVSDDIKIYQLRVRLKGISPMIWRRFLIQEDKTLKDLHYVIQILMGWTDYHLNEFIIHGKHYTIPNNVGMTPDGCDGRHVSLQELKLRLKRKFLYTYDFTAGWEFEIRLEKVLPANDKKTYPICIAGSGASPDEECGGPETFSWLKEEWSYKVFKERDILFERLARAIADESAKKTVRQVVDSSRLEELLYWMDIDKYKRKQVNQYLKFYANNDERWREAFCEEVNL